MENSTQKKDRWLKVTDKYTLFIPHILFHYWDNVVPVRLIQSTVNKKIFSKVIVNLCS